jgi:hypothetical protein
MKGTTLSARSSVPTFRSLQLEGADDAELASLATERERIERAAAQGSSYRLWSIRLTDGTITHWDETMTLCELFIELEEKRHIDPATKLEIVAYLDETLQQVMVIRPRGGICDAALREEIFRHRSPTSS